MLIDSRSLGDAVAVPLQSDICIIGAGAAGIALAREFLETSTSVILLESGGLSLEGKTQHLTLGGISGQFPKESLYLYASRMRFFGGTTNIWTGWCPTLDPLDFKKKDWVPLSGWPIERADLVPFYRRAASLCQIRGYTDSGESPAASDYVPYQASGPGKLHTQIIHFSPPTRFGLAYRSKLEAASNIKVVLHANLTELKLNPSGTEIESIACRTLEGKNIKVKASTYVLATGGIENARLLLLSNDVAKSGIGNDHGLVGRHFMEHMSIDIGHMSLWASSAKLKVFQRHLSNRLQHEVVGVLRPSAEVQAQEQMLNFAVQFERNVNEPVSNSPQEKALSAAARLLDSKDSTEVSNFQLRLRCEQSPNPESRVELGNEVDALGLRKPKLTWKIAERDFVSMKKALNLLVRELGISGTGRVRLYPEELLGFSTPEEMVGNYRPGAFSPHHHHLGTTRMHQDPKQGVVDANCKIHGVSNLYVAGSSVFPTGGFANPTLTLISLALRLADHLKSGLRQ